MPGPRGIELVLPLALALAGCSGGPAPTPPAAVAERLPPSPADFALDITVLPGKKIDALVGDDAPGGIEIVRSKYLVLADGSLRAEAGEGVKYLTRPGRVRILTMAEVAELWERLERNGFAGSRDDLFLGNPALLAPRQDEVLTIVTITSDGFTRSILDRHVPGPEAVDATPPGPVGELVRGVASLAWFGGDAPGAIAIEPIRVDLGPNPYANFLPPEPGRQPPTRATPAVPALGPDTAVMGERRLGTPIEGPGAGTVSSSSSCSSSRRSPEVIRTPVLTAIAVLPFLWTGCASPPPPGLGQRTPDESPTGGLAFTIEWRNVDEFRYERYELDADGSFRGGGGKRAMLHETEWKTALDDRAAGDLAKIFRDLGLVERAPAPGDALAPGETVEIAWWVPGRHGTWTVNGACPDLDPLHEACRGLNLSRFRDTLNALPEAGPRTR